LKNRRGGVPRRVDNYRARLIDFTQPVITDTKIKNRGIPNT
jgi:hypothetical protein